MENILMILFIILGVYIFTVFFLSRLLIPFMGFRRYNPPQNLPPDVQGTIRELELVSSDARSYLENAYKFVRGQWHSERLKTLTRFPLIFRTDLAGIWKMRGYAHCNTINFILYTLLARSKFFTEENIRLRHTFFNGVIHQYMQVHIDATWLDIDPSVSYLNQPIGHSTRTMWFG